MKNLLITVILQENNFRFTLMYSKKIQVCNKFDNILCKQRLNKNVTTL